jgi:23S rRNA pseudouridine1911/1915/1917 synthase
MATQRLTDGTHAVPDECDQAPLDRALRALFPGVSWNKIRNAIQTGKVSVDGRPVLDPRTRVRAKTAIALALSASRPRREPLGRDAWVYVDAHLVVVEKPAGLSSVPYDPRETDNLRERVRQGLRERERRAIPPLGVVHRLDKETSGLLVFARNLAALRALKQQFRFHTVHRRYLAIASGSVQDGTFRSRLVVDRGDGRRGSTENPKLGREAITHVHALEQLDGATLLECRLETGRTHQIRIHLAEAGHPLLGERVYGRDVPTRWAAPRLMLHAKELGFAHPVSGEQLRFDSALPEDMRQMLAELRVTSARAPRPSAPGTSRPRSGRR